MSGLAIIAAFIASRAWFIAFVAAVAGVIALWERR